MIKYLITIILTVALCCACDGEDFSADPTLMPPATQTGANTFGCLIDGWVYTGQRYGPDHKASYYPAYNEDEKATVHVYVWVDTNTSISFNIIIHLFNITVNGDIFFFRVNDIERWIMIRPSIPTPFSKMETSKKKDWKTALSILPALI